MAGTDESTEKDGSRVVFRDEDMKLLIALRSDLDKEFRKKDQKHDVAWKFVQAVFLVQNPKSKATASKLKEKWDYLKTTYNKKKTACSKSGAGADSWKWYAAMDAFCGDGVDVTFSQNAASIGEKAPKPNLVDISDDEENLGIPKKKKTKTEEISMHQRVQAGKRRKAEESLKADRDEIKDLLKLRTQQAAEKNFYLKALVEHTIGKSLQYESLAELALEDTLDFDESD